MLTGEPLPTAHLVEQEIGLEVTDAAKDELAKETHGEEFGVG